MTLSHPVCLQLTVYNYRGGPCYRCLYPVPTPPEAVTNCSDGGVLGVGKSFPPISQPWLLWKCDRTFHFSESTRDHGLFSSFGSTQDRFGTRMYPFSSSLHLHHICASVVLCFANEQNFLLIHSDKKREHCHTRVERILCGCVVKTWKQGYIAVP